ncbi:MAG: trigger factor [Tannerella sp.]|jgi:trigger factor|nr:trigger factor [Tannerella sp.]
MNVSYKCDDALSALLKVEIVKDDYAEPVRKNLQKLRQKVNMPGFRKGMVPLGLVTKLYGKNAMAEEINKIVSNSLFEYIKENNVKMLGEPMQNETEQKPIDFDVDENFEFCFDIALAPEIDVKLSKDDKIILYKAIVNDEQIDKQIDSYQNNFGTYEDAETVEVNDVLKGALVELEGLVPKEGGLLLENSLLMPLYMKGKTEQKKFDGAKVNDVIIFNPFKAYKGAKAELSSLLKIDKEAVNDMKSDFSFEIRQITRHKKAELNKELFDKLFGKDTVEDEAAFRAKIKDSLEAQFARESEYKFMIDVRRLLLDKAKDVRFADDILKRWLLAANEKNTKEEVDKDFPKVVEDLKYHLIKEKLIRDNDVKVEKADIDAYAGNIARQQFAQYGILQPEEDMLKRFVDDMLQKEDTLRNIVDRVMDEKLADLVESKITIEGKEVPYDDFYKLINE